MKKTDESFTPKTVRRRNLMNVYTVMSLSCRLKTDSDVDVWRQAVPHTSDSDDEGTVADGDTSSANVDRLNVVTEWPPRVDTSSHMCYVLPSCVVLHEHDELELDPLRLV